MADTTLKTFPSTKIEALAMLYLEKQDLTGKSPEDVVRLYAEIYESLEIAFDAIRKERIMNPSAKKNFGW